MKNFGGKHIILFLLVLFISLPSRILAENQKVSVGTYFSGYARWAKRLGWSDSDISIKLDSQAAAFHDVGASIGREDFRWDTIEKTQGNFDWSLTGGATDLAISKYNLNDDIIGLLWSAPTWASSCPDPQNLDCYKYPDKDPNLNNWKNYITKVVSRYKNRVKYWEIWNEGDCDDLTFIPKPGEIKEESYFKLLKAAYQTIKNIDPSAKVLINAFGSWNISGDLYHSLIGDSMVKYILTHQHQTGDGWPYFDIFNIHTYSKQDPYIDLQQTKTLLGNWQETANMAIWVTETNPNSYLTLPGQSGNTVDNVANIMPWWIQRQIEGGADKLIWFYLNNWECDPGCADFKTAGLIKLTGFIKQSTWYTMEGLLKPRTPQSIPGFGIIVNSVGRDTDTSHGNDEYTNGIRYKTLELSWKLYEPNKNVFDSAYIETKKNELSTYQSQSFNVVLDLGIHYTPEWVTNLDSNALFKNQYGEVYQPNSDGKNIANTIFNNSVRSVLSSYITRIFADFGSKSFYGARLGGLWYGELHYPEHNFPPDRVNSFWGYDDNAQGNTDNLPSGVVSNPVPGWIPNPVSNGTFEHGDDGKWVLTKEHDTITKDEAHSGESFLKKVNPGAWRNISWQTVQVAQEKTYTFSGFLKSSNREVAACIQILKSSDNSQITIGCTANSTFTEVKGSFTSSEKNVKVVLDANNSASATLSYDDISIMTNTYEYDEGHVNAEKFWAWYENSLINYQNWLISQYRDTGFSGKIFVTHPGYGIRADARINQIQEAINYDLSYTSNPSLNGEIQMGQDWHSQIRTLPTNDKNLIVYMEYIERNISGIDNDNSSDKGVWTPAKYIGYLASLYDRPAWGENSGGNTYADMQTAFKNMVEYGYGGMFWFYEKELYSGNYATIVQYGDLIKKYKCTASNGDANSDGKIDNDDIEIWKQQFLLFPPGSADFNCDEIVDEKDLTIILANWRP